MKVSIIMPKPYPTLRRRSLRSGVLTFYVHTLINYSIGQMYLPPFAECKVEFMRDLLNGKKLVIILNDLLIYSASLTARSR